MPTNSQEVTRPDLQSREVVLARLQCSKDTLYALIDAGKFPPPVRLSASTARNGRVAWRAVEVDAALAALEYVQRPSATAMWTAPQAQPQSA